MWLPPRSTQLISDSLLKPRPCLQSRQSRAVPCGSFSAVRRVRVEDPCRTGASLFLAGGTAFKYRFQISNERSIDCGLLEYASSTTSSQVLEVLRCSLKIQPDRTLPTVACALSGLR